MKRGMSEQPQAENELIPADYMKQASDSPNITYSNVPRSWNYETKKTPSSDFNGQAFFTSASSQEAQHQCSRNMVSKPEDDSSQVTHQYSGSGYYSPLSRWEEESNGRQPFNNIAAVAISGTFNPPKFAYKSTGESDMDLWSTAYYDPQNHG
ncbi:hypothetical protein NHQ30_010071 [Ciborinia camelliae]|nr:hypothetical protein NHQ30_010071 [Ciborinia camelliae]